MNKMRLDELGRVVPVLLRNNVELTDEFDYFRIVSLENNKYDKLAKNPLFFLSYSQEEEIEDGWYPKPFDLRKKANEIMDNNPDYTFVIEESMLESVDKTKKFIVVKSISETIDRLFEYTKKKNKPKVVGVTGSVGKTTTVGIIESVLKEKFNVLRIYSKRITPIILKANIINFLNEKVDYIVMEYSIYYHDHVRILSTLLPPDIACMLNISSSHMGVDTLNTLDDICVNKAEILRYAKACVINIDDEYLQRIRLLYNYIEYNGDPLFPSNIKYISLFSSEENKTRNGEITLNYELIKTKPFILSKLSKIQYRTAEAVGTIAGLTKDEIERGLNNYKPVENRLKREEAFGKSIIFDGDITTYERMKELSDLEYPKTYLVIRKVGSNENIKRISNITDFFNKFSRVFIFDDIEYLEEFKNHENVTVVNNHDFMRELDGEIVYHYSGYYRVWNEFDENNLNIYDREKYPIIKEEPNEEVKKRKL